MSERPPALPDADRILQGLGDDHNGLAGLRVVAETGSTNADLLARPPGQAHRQALIADRQTGGRGRRGRGWFSPPGRNLYLSLGWRFAEGPGALAFLPLVLAVAVARAVEGLGLSGHGIKWPNDLVLGGEKLGGCLVELAGRGADCRAVLGVGLNVNLRGAAGVEAIDQPWTDLASHCPGLSREAVAAAVLRSLLEALDAFEAAGLGAAGFAPFQADWARFDVLDGQAVVLEREGAREAGTARGLGPRGGLLVAQGGETREWLAGDVSVRRQRA